MDSDGWQRVVVVGILGDEGEVKGGASRRWFDGCCAVVAWNGGRHWGCRDSNILSHWGCSCSG